jgi:hypothetical protein
VVVQILDARNPLLFRSKDLEKYVRELSELQGTHKTCLLVINKADYLTPRARRAWAEYLTAHDIDFVFWSAALEQARLDDLARARRRQNAKHNYHGHNIDRVDEGRIRGASSEEEDEEDDGADVAAAAASSSRRRAAKRGAGGKGGNAGKKGASASKQQREDLGDDVLYEDDLEAEEEEEDKKGNTLKASSLWEEQAQQPSATAADAAAPADSAAAAAAPAAASASAAAAAGASTAAPAAASPVTMVHKILTRDALFEHIIAKYCNSSPENKARFESGEKIIVGMCGYPNVGQFLLQGRRPS